MSLIRTVVSKTVSVWLDEDLVPQQMWLYVNVEL